MKINMPVTDKEILMKKSDILVTRTDLKGRITYANDAFVSISGFTHAELIGASHNIVRHPDMPAAAFADLWQCIQQNKPWTAPVKNRTKNGDYYWVEANVAPIYKNGQLHEYLSVRYAPAREQIDNADAFYKKLNAKTASLRPSKAAGLFKQILYTSIWTKSLGSNLSLATVIGFLCYRLYALGDYAWFVPISLVSVTALCVNLIQSHSFSHFLERSITIFYSLAEQKFRNPIDLKRPDQVGDFNRGLYCMQVKLNSDLAESRQNAANALRLNQALDNVQTGVMVTDKQLNIIYLNKFVLSLFTHLAPEIRKQLPDFDPAKLIGMNIDLFHKNPSHQRGILEQLSNSYRSELTIANAHLAVIVNPVINSQNERIGFVAEWSDRMNEVKVKEEISKVVIAAVNGDFTRRINSQNMDGFLLELIESINSLMETTSAGLNEVVRVLGALSVGDLTETITNEYYGSFKQLKDDSNATVENLKGLIGEIKFATDAIYTASKEITMGNHDLSQRTEQQAASLQETAASMQELTVAVQHNTENAKQSNQLALNATAVANKGVDAFAEVVLTMDSISESSHKISDIISVIDSIAFQTNILALNAAVEAARAGDQGRGFAVVAGEVRNLAQRATAAAAEIKSLITDSEQKVSAGSELVTQVGVTMAEIVSAIGSVSVFMEKITAASAEQSEGIEQVNQAISQMDTVTQQNAALVEEAAAAAESLEDQAQNLTGNVAKFKVDQYSAQLIRTPPIVRPMQRPRYDAVAVAAKTKSPKQAVGDEWEAF